jgi:thiol-disulfide isomerase/thioredoxin
VSKQPRKQAGPARKPPPKGRPRPGARRPPPRRRTGPPPALLLVGGIVAVVVVALVVALVASGGSSKKSSSKGQLDYGTVHVSGTALSRFDDKQPAKGDGEVLPTITGQAADGTPVTIAPGTTSQVVVVGAPWCPHCNNELPPLARELSSGTFGPLKLTLVVTGQAPNLPHWPPADWVTNTLNWPTAKAPVVYDDKNATAAQTLGTPAYPYFVFVVSQGKVGSRADGEIGLDAFRQHLQQLR